VLLSLPDDVHGVLDTTHLAAHEIADRVSALVERRLGWRRVASAQ